jgi:glutaredoxin 3
MFEAGRRDEMIERSGGRRTVPQIFIDGRHVGGYDDLSALDKAGDLDRLLRPATP